MTRGPVGVALMSRATSAGMALAAAVAVVTGVFVVRISEQYAAAHTTSTVNDGNQGTNVTGGSGQLSNPQQNQAPVGGSHGS